jgi:hypothetical protein
MKIPGPNKSYCTLIDEEIIRKDLESRNKTPYYPLRPSASGYCGRKLAYDLMGYHGYEPKVYEDKKPSVIRLLNLGHGIEYHALKFIEQIPGFHVRFKQQVVEMFRLDRDGTIIEGSTDAVLWSPEHKALLDVKSVGDRFDSAFSTKWNRFMDKYDSMESMKRFDENAWYIEDLPAFLIEIGDDALVANVYQINLYLCTEFMRTRGLDHGVVYRYNKNNSTHMEIRFKPSMELFDVVRKKYNLIDQAVHDKDPERVPKDFVLGSQSCNFCVYKSRCWGTQTAEFKSFKQKADNINSIPDSENMKLLFSKFSAMESTTESKKSLEMDILRHMVNNNIQKIKLDNGVIYKVFYLKTPKPHYELRRVNE